MTKHQNIIFTTYRLLLFFINIFRIYTYTANHNKSSTHFNRFSNLTIIRRSKIKNIFPMRIVKNYQNFSVFDWKSVSQNINKCMHVCNSSCPVKPKIKIWTHYLIAEYSFFVLGLCSRIRGLLSFSVVQLFIIYKAHNLIISIDFSSALHFNDGGCFYWLKPLERT